MATDSEIDFFTVTPLHENAETASPAVVGARSLRARLAQAAAWVVAAALAVAASFAPLYRISGQLPGQAPLPGDPTSSYFRFYVDGWGRPRLHDTGPLSVDDALNGPRYGIAFCACAALMFLAALLVLAGPRLLAALGPRWPARVRTRLPANVAIAAALLLAGSAAAAALSILPIRKQVHALSYEKFGPGWSLGLAALSCLVCVLVWLWDGLTASRAENGALNGFSAVGGFNTPDGVSTPDGFTEAGGPSAGPDRSTGVEPQPSSDPARPEVAEPDFSAWRPPVDRLE